MSDDRFKGIVSSPTPAPAMTAADILADIRALRRRLNDPDDPINDMQPTYRLGPISPRQHDHLCDALGRPRGSALTEVEVLDWAWGTLLGTTTNPRQSKP